MIDVSIVSDSNYLARGLTLIESLNRFDNDIKFHYLCADKESYEKVKDINDKIVAYDVSNFLEIDPVLLSLKNEHYKYFCWCLASYFTDFLVNKLNKDVTYIDSDIYFHASLKSLLDKINKKDIGIFRHRQYRMDIPNGNGWFNVGVVHFKNTDIAKKALFWWKDAVLHKKYPELATCGDQRYLDAFIQIDPKNIFIDGDIGHGSPWEWQLYDFKNYQKDGTIIWNGKVEQLFYSHFSQFEYSLSENSYTPSTTHYCFTPMELYAQDENLKFIYDDYFDQIKLTHKKYNLEAIKWYL